MTSIDTVFNKLCDALKIDLRYLDSILIVRMNTHFFFILGKYDLVLLDRAIDEYQDILRRIFYDELNKYGMRSIEKVFKFAIHATKAVYEKKLESISK